MNKIQLLGKQTIGGKQFNGIAGGFSDNKKAMLVKDIAEIHSKDLYHMNEAINKNRKRFIDGVDIIDLAIGIDQTDTYKMLLKFGFTKQSLESVKGRGGNIYAFSEKGYAKLLKNFIIPRKINSRPNNIIPKVETIIYVDLCQVPT